MKESKAIYKADLLETPLMNFLMIDIKWPELKDIIAKMMPHGKVASPATIPGKEFEEADLHEHILEISKMYPDIRVEAIPHTYWLNLNLPSGTLKELVSEKNLADITKNHIKRLNKLERKLKGLNPKIEPNISRKFEDVYPFVKDEVLYCVWERLIGQQGEHFLPYGKEVLAAIKLSEEGLMLADSTGMSNNGHGDFEIELYEVISKTPVKKDKIYPIKVLELRFNKTLKGQGVYDFDDKFK